jgi:hypothetical protein
MTSIRMINVQHTNMETHTLRLVWWSPSRKEKKKRKKKKKPKWILQFYPTCFYTGLHMILECRDTKLWPISGCIPMFLPFLKCFYSGLHTILECKDTKLWPVSGYITESLVSTLKGRAGNKCPSQQRNGIYLTSQCLSFNNNNTTTTRRRTPPFTLGVRASPAVLSMWPCENIFHIQV